MINLIVFISFLLIFLFIILPPVILYKVLLVRGSKKKWRRRCSRKYDAVYSDLYRTGEIWFYVYSTFADEICIESCGYKLCGFYFDFGFQDSAIIVAGRGESCIYSCYYAEPYRCSDCNILVIDNRSHGASEGRYDNTGFVEYKDILAWAAFLHSEKKQRKIFCHGICSGAATCLYAFTEPECPDYMAALVADGMFKTFRECLANHLRIYHVISFPTVLIVMALLSKHSGHNAFRDGPVTEIEKCRKPVLFLYGKQDPFSLVADGMELYSKCTSAKKIVLFEQGGHAKLRSYNTKYYDEEIIKFIRENECP